MVHHRASAANQGEKDLGGLDWGGRPCGAAPLQRRHSPAGGRAGQGSPSGEYDIRQRRAHPPLAPVCPGGPPEGPSDKPRPQLLWPEPTTLRGVWKQTTHFVVLKNK